MTDIPDRDRDCDGPRCVAAMGSLRVIRNQIITLCTVIESLRGRIQSLTESIGELYRISALLSVLGVAFMVLSLLIGPMGFVIGWALFVISLLCIMMTVYLARIRAQRWAELLAAQSAMRQLRDDFDAAVEAVTEACPPGCWDEEAVTQPRC